MPLPAYKQKLADYYAGQPCTLNGKDASIAGLTLPFAWVYTLDGAQKFEYAWETVDKIMREKGGAFHA